MELQLLEPEFTVCKLDSLAGFDLAAPFFFLAQTGREISLVCPSDALPENATEAEPGWRAFRVAGTLDFSLVGVIARISAALAAGGVPLFVVSTFDTDYVLVKREKLQTARALLEEEGNVFSC